MRVAVFLVTAAMAAPAAAQTLDRPAAYTNAESCLRDNVVAAVGASDGAADAADFLLTYICAGPVSAAGNYERNSAAVVTMKEMFAGMAHAGQAAVDDMPATSDSEPHAEDDGADVYNFSDMAKGYEDITVDPVTGDIVVPPGTQGPMTGMVRAQGSALAQFSGATPPVFLRTLAGQLVIEHRR